MQKKRPPKAAQTRVGVPGNRVLQYHFLFESSICHIFQVRAFRTPPIDQGDTYLSNERIPLAHHRRTLSR